MKTIYCHENIYSTNVEKHIHEICNRHILAFGENIQNRISNLTVGVVSVGGLGMLLIEQLMRLFPKKLIFIDKDNVELSNLNRLVGANKTDAKIKVKKVDLASRNILNFNPDQKILSILGDFLDKHNQEKFRECDLIIGGSDSNAVRIATNRLCLAHGIIYFDCGVGAIVKNKQLIAAGGQIIKILPDSDFCLHCSSMFNVKEAMNEFLSIEERTRQENQGYIRGADIAAPQVYSLNMMVASWAIWLFKRMVSEEALDFDGIAIDAKDFKTYTWKEPRKKINHCPTCGVDGIVFQGDDVDLLCRDTSESEFIPVAVDRETVNQDINEMKAKTEKADCPLNSCIIIGDNFSNPFDFRVFH